MNKLLAWRELTKTNFNTILFILGAGGFVFVWISTIWGSGLIWDSYQYVSAARNLTTGNGLYVSVANGNIEPLTHFPPMFSLLLALFEGLGIDSIGAARFLNAGLFSLLVFSVGYSQKKITNDPLASVYTAGLISLSFVMVIVHSWILSEPLFLVLGTASLLVFAGYIEDHNRKDLIIAAVLMGMASLTRFIGLSLVVTGILAIFAFTNSSPRRKMLDSLVMLIIGVLPAAVWTLRNFQWSGLINRRPIGWHPPNSENFIQAVNTMITWFIPDQVVDGFEMYYLAGVGLLLAVGAVFYYMKISNRESELLFSLIQKMNSPLLKLNLVYICLYFVTIVMAKSVFDPKIPFDNRMLSPVFVSVIIFLGAVLPDLWDARLKKYLKTGIFAFSAGLIIVSLVGTGLVVEKYNRFGVGLAKKSWRQSEMISSLSTHPELPVYTNSLSTYYLWADGSSSSSIGDFLTLRETGLADESLVILFNLFVNNEEKEIIIDGLEIIIEDNIGAIYLYTPE